MTDAEFDAACLALHRQRDDLLLRVGRLSLGVDKLRDEARMLRIMTEVEKDIMEATA